MIIIILIYKDCKSWFDEGYNTSGVYTINPDEQTPFEVYCDLETMMVVDGLYFRGDKMALLISIGTGQTMRMGLVILLE